MRLFNEAKRNSGIASSTTIYSDEMIALYENATDRTKYPNFDWQGYMYNSALVQNHTLSVSGGNKGTTYNISLGYIDQPGTLRGFANEKYDVRANIKSRMADWVTIGSNMFIDRSDRSETAGGQGDANISLLAQAPTYAPWLPDGSGRYTYTAYPFEGNNKNQAAIVDNASGNYVTYDVNAQLWVEFEFFKGFTWYTKGAANLVDQTSKNWRPLMYLYNFHTLEQVTQLDVGTVGLTVDNQRTFYTNLFSYFKYETTLKNSHHITAQAGYSQETNRYESLTGYRKNFLAPLTELNAGTADTNQSASGTTNQWALMSLFGRLNYDYLGRYLAEVSLRYDGTSRMIKEKRWGSFPSFSAGWRLSEESFIKNLNVNWLNNFKLRGSYGLLGNQNIGNYPYQSMLAYTGNYTFDNSSLSTGVAQTNFSNKDIKWESTSIFDIGLDATIFKGLSITYDYYKKNTTDILRAAQVSALLGLSAPTVNSGAMINYGHELSVQYDGLVYSGALKGMNYGGGVYFNKYRNEAANFGVEEISGYNLRRNGLPYNSYYMLDFIGVFQTQEEIDSSPKQFSDNVQPGDLKYRDVNNDGVVNNDDRTVIPGRFPEFEYSFNGYANWKGFDLSVFFQGVEGQKFFVEATGMQPFRQGCPPTKKWLTDRWTGPGTSNTLTRIMYFTTGNSQNTRSSDWFLQDASYLRLKNLVIGYTLPQSISSRFRCNMLRVYFSGDNLFTWTGYEDLDPERPGDGTLVQYPQNKIVSFGLNINF
jgi:TonB-linked SusC/RagA family outer membrane protein